MTRLFAILFAINGHCGRGSDSDVNDPEPGSAKTRSQRLFAIGSVRLGVGRPNHLAPFLGISDKELPELGRSADERCTT